MTNDRTWFRCIRMLAEPSLLAIEWMLYCDFFFISISSPLNFLFLFKTICFLIAFFCLLQLGELSQSNQRLELSSTRLDETQRRLDSRLGVISKFLPFGICLTTTKEECRRFRRRCQLGSKPKEYASREEIRNQWQLAGCRKRQSAFFWYGECLYHIYLRKEREREMHSTWRYIEFTAENEERV